MFEYSIIRIFESETLRNTKTFNSRIEIVIFCSKDQAFEDIDPSMYEVTCGDWDIKESVELERHQTRNVKDIILHPGFNHKKLTHGHDIAIVTVDKDFRMDNKIISRYMIINDLL